jgi:hypothetical protein
MLLQFPWLASGSKCAYESVWIGFTPTTPPP